MPPDQGRDACARAVDRVAFDHDLRTGVVLGAPARHALREDYERKFNPNHDEQGRFSSGPGGPKKPKTPRLPGTGNPTQKAHYNQGQTAIDKSGDYRFSGLVGFHDDHYDFDDRKGRRPLAEIATQIGKHIRGKPFFVYVVGVKNVQITGRVGDR